MNDTVQQQADNLPALPTPSLSENRLSHHALILEAKSMDAVMSFATLMAKGRATIPKHLQESPADCAAVVTQSLIWRMSPFAVAQKTHVTQGGQLGYEAQLINAVITTNAPIKGRPEYEFFGDWKKILGKVEERKSDKGGKYYVQGWKPADEEGLGIRCTCTLIGEDEPRVVEILLVQCWPRFSTQWATDPQQQICYAALRKWARRYTPDVLLGVYTPDELLEGQEIKDITPGNEKRQSKPADVAGRKQQQDQGPSEKLLAAARNAAERGREAFGEFWKNLKGIDRNALRNDLSDLQKRVETAEARTVEADPAEPPAEQKASTYPPVDDEFVRQMDAASGQAGEYVPE